MMERVEGREGILVSSLNVERGEGKSASVQEGERGAHRIERRRNRVLF